MEAGTGRRAEILPGAMAVTLPECTFERMSSYWYCVKHKRVEGADGCAPIDRLGPYDTEEEASHALEKAKQRNEEWDNDPKWNDTSK
jgi:hypothetical protein